MDHGDKPFPWLPICIVDVVRLDVRVRGRAGCLVFRAVLIGAGLGVVIDLIGAWIWLSFITDGEPFPY